MMYEDSLHGETASSIDGHVVALRQLNLESWRNYPPFTAGNMCPFDCYKVESGCSVSLPSGNFSFWMNDLVSNGRCSVVGHRSRDAHVYFSDVVFDGGWELSKVYTFACICLESENFLGARDIFELMRRCHVIYL